MKRMAAGAGDRESRVRRKRAMREGFHLLPMALALLAACSPGSSAQSDDAHRLRGDWVDASGKVSLSYAALGWRPLATLRHAGALLEVASPHDTPTHAVMCSVLPPRSGGLAGGTQAQINALVDRQTAADMPPTVQADPNFKYARRMVDGVAVVDLTFTQYNMYQRWRIFRIPAPIGTTQYTLACAVTLPSTPGEQSELESVLSSLHISNGQAP